MKTVAVRRSGGNALVLVLISLALCACGDDDTGDVGADSGIDAGGGSGAGGTGGSGMIPRNDAQVTSGDAVPECNRFDPLACGAGEQCRVVLRRAPGAAGFTIYGGCVQGVDGRGLGQPCDQFDGISQAYEAPRPARRGVRRPVRVRPLLRA